jgi:glycosyltransferase involved in cell wall biosynthesis
VGYETTGSSGHVAELQRRARELGIHDRVEFLGAIPQRADLLETALKSDIGLALMLTATLDHNCETMTGASNKAFDYMACGLPFVVSNLADWREMFVDSGYALSCDPEDPESIAAAVGLFVEDTVLMRAMGESGRQKILADWNYEKAFRPALDLITLEPVGSHAKH